ncbi:RNA polymerase sigma factor [Streptomyces sp. NPDC051555]|uniref:RNA polymerase sigma factor n=1 Tax=Streptomyces sp. NPDC051555 TaxID=3365657 RepID=UPI0037AC2FEB
MRRSSDREDLSGLSVTDKIHKLEAQSRRYRSVIYRIVPPRYVDQVHQDALVAMFKHLDAGHTVDDLFAYFQTICVNTARAEYKRILKRAETLVETGHDVLDTVAPSPEDSVAEAAYESVHAVLADVLEPVEHRAYVLTVVFGLTSDEVGRHVGLTGSAVRKAVRRAEKKLRTEEVLDRFHYRPRGTGVQEG